MAWAPILVRYGEIGIKSASVRAAFERRLIQRIEEQLARRGVEAEVIRERGRVIVRASDVEKALDGLVHTFGVVSVSPTIECPGTPDGVAELALAHARAHLPQGGSFAVRVRRSGTHTFTSLDVAKRCAERVFADLADRDPRVDLDAPDLEMFAEVREAEGYFFTRNLRGPGGLPLGSQGRVGVLVEGRRAAHAAWLLGKRGSALMFYAQDLAAARAWLAPLEPWLGAPRVHEIPGADRASAFEALAARLPEDSCQALVLSDGLEEALTTAPLDQTLGVAVFRPLVGFPAERFTALARDARLPEEA